MSRQETLTNLRKILASRLSQGELETLCFDLGIDFDDLPGETKSDKARELIEYIDNRDQISRLIEVLKLQRPDIPWDSVIKEAKEPPSEVVQFQEEDGKEPHQGYSQRLRAWFGKLSDAAQVAIIVAIIGLCGGLSVAVVEGVMPYVVTRIANSTLTPTHTPTATITPTPSPTTTRMPSPSSTHTPSSTPTATPTPSPSPTKTNTPTPSPSPTKTNTPTPSPSPTMTNTPTPTPVPIQLYNIREGDTLESIAAELLGHEDRSLELCVMNRGSIGVSDCYASTVTTALTNRIGANIKYIPLSILLTTISLPHMFYDAEVYEYFSKNDDWVWYTVEVGDSDGLSNIAYKFYRDAGLWPEICVFNRDKLGTQSRCTEEVLLIGMRLRIPMLTPPAAVTIRPEDTSPTPTNTQTPEPPILTATITPSDTLSPTPTPTP